MDVHAMTEEARQGRVTGDYVDFLKHRTISDVLASSTPEGASALWAYASFLNAAGITPDTYPLYIGLLASNNRYAIDALLDGHVPERYLDCVAPNPYIVRSIFETFTGLKANEIYAATLRVFLGFLAKVYASAAEGYALYAVRIEEVNSLGKFLDESGDQEEPLNRAILDVLACIADLEQPHVTDPSVHAVAAQAGRIRSDFFDSKRSLRQSITEAILAKAADPRFGTPPRRVYR